MELKSTPKRLIYWLAILSSYSLDFSMQSASYFAAKTMLSDYEFWSIEFSAQNSSFLIDIPCQMLYPTDVIKSEEQMLKCFNIAFAR